MNPLDAESPCGSDDDGPQFQISFDLLYPRVTVVGELDRAQAPHLIAAVAALLGAGHRSIAVSTERVTFCDAGGLRALLAAQRLALLRGGELTLTMPSRCIRRLLSIVGLDPVVSASSDALSIPAVPLPQLFPRSPRPRARPRA